MPQRLNDQRPALSQGPVAEPIQRRSAPYESASAVDHSPRMVAQRRAIDATFGTRAAVGVAQRQPQAVVQRTFFDTAKVGLELTFNNAFTNRLTDDGFAGITKVAAAQQWNYLQEGWVDEIGGQGPGAETVDVDRGSHKNKDIGGDTGDFPNYQFTYTPLDIEGQPRPFESWWFRLSLDPGVLEIQTAPATGAQIATPGVGAADNPIGDIIQYNIFEVATAQALAVGGGGGHLNVDFASGFDSKLSQIPSILAATEVEKNSTGEHDAAHALIDHDNESLDPFLGTSRRRMRTTTTGTGKNAKIKWDGEFKEREEKNHSGDWIDELGSVRPETESDFKVFRQKHAEWLHAHPTTKQVNKADTKGEQFGSRLDDVGKVLHYQAVNIDHVLEVDKAARRIEFRFFKGQATRDEIAEGIRMIERIKTRADRRS